MTSIGLRLPEDVTMRLDQWAEKNKVTRSQAIRSLLELALAGSPSGQRSPNARSRAHDLANTQLDKLLDPSAPEEERQQRKRRLLKGPKEFQELRAAVRSKAKSYSQFR